MTGTPPAQDARDAQAGGGLDDDHKAREVALHRHVSESYRLRYGSPFSSLFQTFWNRELLDLLPSRIEAPALDNGCGTGVLLPDLAARCDAIFGVDLSPDMLAQARQRAVGADLRVGDLESLPYPDGFFRTVICRGSLHHAASPRRALIEAHRVLAPGGRLALTEPSDDFPPVRWARAALYRFSSKFDTQDRAFRRRGVESLLREAGFDVERVKRFGFVAYALCGFPDVIPIMLHMPGQVPLARVLIRTDGLLSRIPAVRVASFHLMMLARKPA